ncbi:PREDICTED: putative nuclease HARBI1, partial [Rhagoletis zephyria]|uniref:putative nuclease HARBI1 n=1 Tax=Rhagoletis zephyria TaxID=28612 RepID=UPI0008118118
YSQYNYVPDPSGGGRQPVTAKKSLYMYIWYVSNTVTFRQLGNLFGVSQSAAWSIVQRVTGFLISIRNEHVKWPEGHYLNANVDKFYQKKRIPGVIGAIDCTHIVIKRPKVQKEMYFNRKRTYSIVLQAVVDANKKFIHITCGEPGSLHDYRVLTRSKLFQDAENHYEEMFPNSYFIIGDSAYPSTKWLVSPFKDYGNLNESQRKFNEIHSSTRMVVENAFGLLKGRFRRLLRFTEQTDLKVITKIVVSACVLHNICISFDDLCVIDELYEAIAFAQEEQQDEFNLNETLNRRQNLFNYLRVVSLLLDERSELRLNRQEEVVNELLDGVFASSSSSEDSEGETEDHPKCNNFEATLDAMGGSDFKMHMRLKRVTVEYLISNIQKFIEITT